MERANKFMGGCCLIDDPSGTSKTKLFAAFAIFYLQRGLQVLMTGLTDASADVMAEQLSKLINDSPVLNLKLFLWVYRLKIKSVP